MSATSLLISMVIIFNHLYGFEIFQLRRHSLKVKYSPFNLQDNLDDWLKLTANNRNNCILKKHTIKNNNKLLLNIFVMIL